AWNRIEAVTSGSRPRPDQIDQVAKACRDYLDRFPNATHKTNATELLRTITLAQPTLCPRCGGRKDFATCTKCGGFGWVVINCPVCGSNAITGIVYDRLGNPMLCPRCGGKVILQVTCDRCGGSKLEPCSLCRGSGEVSGAIAERYRRTGE